MLLSSPSPRYPACLHHLVWRKELAVSVSFCFSGTFITVKARTILFFPLTMAFATVDKQQRAALTGLSAVVRLQKLGRTPVSRRVAPLLPSAHTSHKHLWKLSSTHKHVATSYGITGDTSILMQPVELQCLMLSRKCSFYHWTLILYHLR